MSRLDEKTGRVDRHVQCPFMLRVFINDEKHHSLDDYQSNKLPSHEIQIYTWPDSSLKELVKSITAADPSNDAFKRGSRLHFKAVYPDFRSAHFRGRDLGTVVVGESGPDDTMTLMKGNFQVGDFIDIAVLNRGGRSPSPPSRRSDRDRN